MTQAPTALVLHHDSTDTLRATLEALSASTMPPARTVVLDNSPAAARAVAAALCGLLGVEHVSLPNEGYGAAMNRGLDLVETDTVLLLTHESLLAPDCVSLLASALEAEPGRVAVGPLLARHEDPAAVWSAGGVLHDDWRVTHVVEPRAVRAWTDRAPQDVDWLDGAVLLLRTAAVRQVDGFDERFFLYWEEVDLERRLFHAGGRLTVVPSAVAWQSSGSDWATAMMHRNKLLFVEKHGGRSAVLRVATSDLRDGTDRRARARGTVAYLRRRWGLLR